MTTAFVALLIGVAGAALLLALVAHLWVNRTPSTDERFDAYGRVPLFGVDLSAAPAQIELRDERESHEDINTESDIAEASVRMRNNPSADRPSIVENAGVVVHPVSQSANGREQSFAPPVARHVAPAQPSDVGRSTRAGWGATPGWPVASHAGLAETPKYVAPVSPDRSNVRSIAPAFDTNRNANGNRVLSDGVPGAMIEGHQLRFSTPVEGTLQFLPGRLEISSGLDTGREIRFVRVPGPNGTEVTFGRNAGPLYRHIQLRDQTVSREHARLVFADGNWTLTNLSKTNPVAHNGRILHLAEEQLLGDGDRLEMGEVVFNFRSR